jgi:hypothetical protein
MIGWMQVWNIRWLPVNQAKVSPPLIGLWVFSWPVDSASECAALSSSP